MPGGWEWLIIVGVLVLLFGVKRLPEMARSVGQSARVFKGEMKGLKDDEGDNTALSARHGGSGAGIGASAQQPVGQHPVEPERRDPVRPDTDR